MADPVARVLVTVGIVVLALAAAIVVPRLAARRAEGAAVDLAGIGARVLLFTSIECSTCDAARSVMDDIGVAFEEIVYGDDPDRFDATGVDSVPLLLIRDRTGAIVGRIGGTPTPRRVRSLLSRAGITTPGAGE